MKALVSTRQVHTHHYRFYDGNHCVIIFVIMNSFFVILDILLNHKALVISSLNEATK